MKLGILNRHAIRGMWEACHHDANLMCEQIKARFHLDEGEDKALRPANFNLRQLAEGMGANVDPASDGPLFQEAVTASQFNTIVGTLLSKVVMDAYEPYTKIVDELVTKFTSVLETDKIPGTYLTGDLDDVHEHGEYPHLADIAEKYVEIGHQKRGLILDITDEAVRFDRTNTIMDRANQMGERMGRDREERIMSVIQDITGFKAWYPSGTETDLYQNAQGAGDAHEYDNLVADVLSDYTDVNALYLLLRLMKDDNGDNIRIVPKTLLVPVTLEITAIRIINNEVLAGGTNNERNPMANKFKILSHPLLDDQSTTAWYLGDFKKNFREKVIIPPQVLTRRMGDNNEDAWRKDIVASVKVRYDSKVGAVDYRYVGKSTGA